MGTDEDSKEGRLAFSVVEDCRKRGPGGRREADVHTDVCSQICPRQQICWKTESREGGRSLLLPCFLLGAMPGRVSQRMFSLESLFNHGLLLVGDSELKVRSPETGFIPMGNSYSHQRLRLHLAQVRQSMRQHHGAVVWSADSAERECWARLS